MNQRQALVKLGTDTADIEEDAGHHATAHVLRRLARELAAPTVEQDRCRCGAALFYAGHGRRRRWCSERCRRRYRP